MSAMPLRQSQDNTLARSGEALQSAEHQTVPEDQDRKRPPGIGVFRWDRDERQHHSGQQRRTRNRAFQPIMGITVIERARPPTGA